MWNFSLLFPENAAEAFTLDAHAVNDLSLEMLVSRMSGRDRERGILLDTLKKMPADEATVRYRREVFQDLIAYPEMCEKLKEIFDAMEFYSLDRTNAFEKNATIWDFLKRLKDLENYCSSVIRIKELLDAQELRSEALKNLKQFIDNVYQNSGFKELTEDIGKMVTEISMIKSMTLGINFDQFMNPVSIGIVSMNQFPVKEQGILEHYLGFLNKKQELTMLTYSKKPDSDEIQLMNNMSRLMERMMPKVVAPLRSVLNKHVNTSGQAFLRLKDEFLFYQKFIELKQKVETTGLSCGFPEIVSEEAGSFSDICLNDFYNLKLAVSKADGVIEQEIICNDIVFRGKERIMILTGPNRGGKTVFTQGLGLAYLLFQHGLFTTGSGGQMPVIDGIFTHFPADENDTLTLGRLGEEAERFGKIAEKATSRSLLLFNESFATTSHSESVYIATDALKFMCCLGALTCFNTHMHELAQDLETLNSTEGCISHAVSAVMGQNDGNRSYKITYKAPDGVSFARDIAYKYGITFEQLKKQL